MADPTLQESLYKMSVRKFFVDQIELIRGKNVFFDRQYSIPTDDTGAELKSWFVVGFEGIHIGTVSTGYLEVLCFSRGDESSVVLSSLRDILVDMIVDEDMPDGIRRVPYYSSSWDEIGGMLGYIDTNDSGVKYGADGTQFSIVNVTLRWGTK